MGLLHSVGQAVMRRNSYYLAAILAGAFVTEIVVDGGVNAFWDWHNRGVRVTRPAPALTQLSLPFNPSCKCSTAHQGERADGE